MARKKPSAKESSGSKNVDTFLSGASMNNDGSMNNNERIEVVRTRDTYATNLRMPRALKEMIDRHIKGTNTGISRNAWIVQAIAEKLKRDNE